MAIQFRCPQCDHPIEVDDEHAGQAAACPYCQHVVRVPVQSTFEHEQTVPARPATPTDTSQSHDETPPDPTVPYYAAPQHALDPRRLQNGKTLGGYALILCALAVILFGAGAIRSLILLADTGYFEMAATSQPSPEQIRQIQNTVGMDPWVAGLQMGGMFFFLAAAVMAIVSLILNRRGNWRAIVTLCLCGCFLLCLCGSVIMLILTGGAGL